jgi:hypothetical protein
MNYVRMQESERTLLRGVVTAVFVGCCLALLLTATSGAVVGQEITVSVQPTDSEVEVGNETTLQVVVEGATEGIGAHDIEVSLADGDVAEMTNITFVRDPLPVQNQAEVRDEGTTAVGVGAMGNNTYEGAEEIAVLTLTVEGKMPGESTELTVTDSSIIGNQTGGPYTLSETPSATLAVVENESDGDGGGDGSDGGGDGGSDDGTGDDGGDGTDDGTGDGTGDDGTGDGTGDDGTDDGTGDEGGDGTDDGTGDEGSNGDGTDDGGDDGGDGFGPGLGIVTGFVALLAIGSLLVARGRAGGDGGKD